VHIPDGYLSPLISAGMGAATIPGWAIATRRVQSVLSDRMIPLLAIFAALSFTIMMFNIPVPGGTTAHGVGGTLAAIVLGPWAAAIVISVALIIQALFFGDGGVLAIFVNCFNMAFILPFVGYLTYRLLAGRSAMLSSRRVWAAGIGAYVGITASALAVGVELGIQPVLFTENGHALYSPYGLAAAVPAMLAAHMFGASIVEGLITALGVAYLQERHPEYLTSLRGAASPQPLEPTAAAADHEATDAGAASPITRRPLWQTATAITAGGLFLLAVLGLATGGGDPGHAFGADWSRVDWASVSAMLLVVALIAVVLVPLAWMLLPRSVRGVGTAFVAAAVLAPLGLIAPGFAYGEGTAEDVHAAFGYVPQGLQNVSTALSAPLAGYSVPLPFLGDANPVLWRQAMGYEIAGLLGILMLGGAMLGLARLLARGRPAGATDDGRSAGRVPTDDRIGWLEQTVSGITGSIEHAVFTEEHARSRGWLQGVDPRAKLGMFLVLVLAAGLSASLVVLAAMYLLILGAARASRVPFEFFVRRVWLGIPLFAGVVVLPAVFLVPGPRLFELALGPLTIAPSVPGLEGAILFVARVGVSVSLAVLLVMTTPWADLLKSLQALRVPQLFILVLAMAYRYIFLFLHQANGMFEARKSRVVGRTSGGEQRRWISGSMGNLLNRSFKMSNDVYAAMVARGFSGEMRTLSELRMRTPDWSALGAAVAVAVVAVVAGVAV
jgi:cobalt/nickel transport system permease protein